MVWRSVASSSSRLARPRRVSCDSRMSTMWVACTSLNSNGVRLQRGDGRLPVLRRPDGGDDGVDHVEGLDQSLDDVGPVPGLVGAGTRTGAG